MMILSHIRGMFRNGSCPTEADLQSLEALVRTAPNEFAEIKGLIDIVRGYRKDMVDSYAVDFDVKDLKRALGKKESTGEALCYAKKAFATFKNGNHILNADLKEGSKGNEIELQAWALYGDKGELIYPQKPGGAVKLVVCDSIGNRRAYPLDARGQTGAIPVEELGIAPYQATLL